MNCPERNMITGYCLRMDAYVPLDFCRRICQGRRTRLWYDLHLRPGRPGRNLAFSPAWRNYCQGCQYFDNCCRCRLGPTGPGGQKIKLALLWAQGAPCPLGRWPQRSLPSNPPSNSP